MTTKGESAALTARWLERCHHGPLVMKANAYLARHAAEDIATDVEFAGPAGGHPSGELLAIELAGELHTGVEELAARITTLEAELAGTKADAPARARYMDEIDAAGDGGRWLEAIALKHKGETPYIEIKTHRFHQSDGGVTTLWVNRRVRATFVIVRDEANFSVVIKAQFPYEPIPESSQTGDGFEAIRALVGTASDKREAGNG